MAEVERGAAEVGRIARLMVGHELGEEHFRESLQAPPEDGLALQVEGLGLRGRFEDFRLELRRGEIVSLVGLLGSGKEEVCRCLSGAARPDSRDDPGGWGAGALLLAAGRGGRGHRLRAHRPAQRGLATTLDVADNINFLVLRRMMNGPFLSPRRERENAERWVKECLSRPPHCRPPAATSAAATSRRWSSPSGWPRRPHPHPRPSHAGDRRGSQGRAVPAHPRAGRGGDGHPRHVRHPGGGHRPVPPDDHHEGRAGRAGGALPPGGKPTPQDIITWIV